VVVSSALLHIAAVSLILPCWKNFSGGPVLGWVFVRLMAGPAIGVAGWLGLFYGYWRLSEASKILLGLC